MHPEKRSRSKRPASSRLVAADPYGSEIVPRSHSSAIAPPCFVAAPGPKTLAMHSVPKRKTPRAQRDKKPRSIMRREHPRDRDHLHAQTTASTTTTSLRCLYITKSNIIYIYAQTMKSNEMRLIIIPDKCPVKNNQRNRIIRR